MKAIASEKEKVFFHAILALAGRGVDLNSVKMQAIADEAGLGKSTIYEYFKNKEELLLATMEYCLGNEIDYLGKKLADCRSFCALLDQLLSYVNGLVQERAAAYSMLCQVFGGRGDSQSCPMLEQVHVAIEQLMDFSCQLAEKEDLSTVDRDYFVHVLLSGMMSHAVTLLRMKNLGQLNEKEIYLLEERSRRMILSSLK